jgi:hypothetical protein
MKQADEIVACPCYRICSVLGIEPGRWCSYHTSDLPVPGLWRFDPKEKWCPPGVQANVMMLSALLTNGDMTAEHLESVLKKVREMIRTFHAAPAAYNPDGQK